MAHFQPLFSVEVEHEFFPDRYCRGLRLEPMPSCVQRLEKAGCVTRRAAGGIQGWSASLPDPAPEFGRDGNQQPAYLNWLAFAQDPWFARFTSVPALDGAILVFDSARTCAIDDDGRTRFHAGEEVSQADLQPLDSPAVSELLSPRERLLSPIFIVRIAASALQQQGAAAPRYYLRFGARTTLWKYYFSSALSVDSVQVVDIERETDFRPGAVELLPDGRTAVTVCSETEIELLERSSRRFQLRQRDGVADKVVIERLPVARVADEYEELIDAVKRRVSHIYVGC